MKEKENWRNTKRWSRLADGYIICPCCGCVVHPRTDDLHAATCYAIKQAMGESVTSQPVSEEGE